MTGSFLPTTLDEVNARGWDTLDVILVSGDSYIDSPFIGTAVIGRQLEAAGFRVGVIAQPDIHSPRDITRLGEPSLFWGVTGGSVDSMVANYTASKKWRKSDDYTPGGVNDRRPDRAVIAYSNLIRQHFKATCPLVLGGIEASLRRVAHYDFWSDRLRRAILFDAKADYLLYGMAEESILELAEALRNRGDVKSIRGLSYLSHEAPSGYLELPSYEAVCADPRAFIAMFHQFYLNSDPVSAKGLFQRHGDRMVVQNPPAHYSSQRQMDGLYALPFQRQQHPYYERQGAVKALETIRFSISTHRGCYGECRFCSIAVHEGRTVRWRSEDSIAAEAELFTRTPGFKGYIFDVGGPSANMYGFECKRKLKLGACPDKSCLFPTVCPALKINHASQIRMLRRLRAIPGVKKAFVASGIRYDMILSDSAEGRAYLKEIIDEHVSGQMKIAPEHSEDHVLAAMGKPGKGELVRFKRLFDELSAQSGKEQYLTYYLIAAYPGCTEGDMRRLKEFAGATLHISPEQVQIFTPLPSTYAAVIYYTGLDPFTLEPIFVERDSARRERQKLIVTAKPGDPPAKPAWAGAMQGSRPARVNRVSSSPIRSKGSKP